LNIAPWLEFSIIGGLVAILLLDLWIVGRRPHEPSMRESAIGVAFYVALALLFGLGILIFQPTEAGRYAGEFYAGWLTEYSLSIDNLFVFVIIMARFAVPREFQQKVLFIGIVIALVLRGIFIALGAAAIERFVWVFFIFGAFLIYTAWKLAFHREDEDEYTENALIRWSRRALPMSADYDGAKMRTVVDGKRLFTPMVVVMIAIGTTDLLFALDSIPAIFGLTQEWFLVLTANIFALMGLRQLYFLLGGLLDRLVYLSLGLSVVLGFIGVKLILHALHENELPFVNGGHHVEWAPDIPIWLSLSVIIGTLVVTAVASLWKSSRDAKAEAVRAES
jgi:tellurite resistance protein TerC